MVEGAAALAREEAGVVLASTSPVVGAQATDAVRRVPHQAVVDVLAPGERARVRGRLDVHSVADARTVLHALVDGGSGPVRLDVSEVSVADATGLGLVVSVHRRALRAGRQLVLVDVPPALDRLLRVSRLHRVLTTADSDDGEPSALVPAAAAAPPGA